MIFWGGGLNWPPGPDPAVLEVVNGENEVNLHVGEGFSNQVCLSHLLMFVKTSGSADDNVGRRAPTNQDLQL